MTKNKNSVLFWIPRILGFILAGFIYLFFIDVGQVIMLTFVHGFERAAAGNFAEMFNLREMLAFRDTTEPPTGSEFLGASILAVAFILIALIVMVIMVVVLLIRMVMLWILVILSPLAYILAVFPGSQKYASQWWSSFWKYVMIGPVLAFFVWLALTVTATTTPDLVTKIDVETQDVESQVIAGDTEGDTFAASVNKASEGQSILKFVLGIAMLMGSLMVAQQMGGVAGNLAGKAASAIQRGGAKAALTPFAAARSLTGYGSRQLYRHTGVQLNPRHWIQGIRQNFQRRSIQDIEAGRVKAGESLMKGGSIGSMIKGFTGATEDFSDYYFRGFLGTRGLIGERDKKTGQIRGGRIWRSIRGGEEKVSEIRESIKGERAELKKRKDILERRATQEEKPEIAAEVQEKRARLAAAQRQLSSNQFDESSLQFFQEKLNGLDQARALIPKKEDRTEADTAALEKLDLEANHLREIIEKINLSGSVRQSAEMHVGDLKLKMDTARIQAMEAREGGQPDLEKMLTKEAEQHSQDIKAITEALEFMDDPDHDEKAIVDEGSIKKIAEVLGRGGKTQAAADATTLSDVAKARVEASMHRRDQGKARLAGNEIDEKKFANLAANAEQQIQQLAPTMGIKAEFLSDWQKGLKEDLAELQEELNEQKVGTLAYKLKSEPLSSEEKKRLEDEATGINKKIDQLNADAIAARGPQAFFAMRGRRGLIQEEMRKLTTTNEDELIMLAENAVRTGNDLQLAAVSLQAARVGHWNELLNAFKTTDVSKYIDQETGEYHKKTPWGEKINPDHAPVDSEGHFMANQAGTSAFVRDVMMGQLKMGEQDAFSIQNDLSNIAESIHHWFAGQSIGSKDGLFYQRDAREQQQRVMIEMGKRDEEKLLREGNRLAWTTEGWVDPKDHDKGRVSKLSPVGIWALDTKHNTITQNLARGRFNKNMAMNLMSEGNWATVEEIYRRKKGDDKKAFGKFMRDVRKFAGEAAADTAVTMSEQVDTYLDAAMDIQDRLRKGSQGLRTSMDEYL
ncbi:type IV secretion system protein [Patescibacteria group bacterium]